MCAWQHRNSAGLSAFLPPAGRCSDHKQRISPLVGRCRAVSDPRALAAFQSRKEGRSSARDCRGVAQKSFEANPGTTPPRETRFLKTSVVDRGLNLHRSKPVLRADSTRCLVLWQIVGPARRATILSGFSLRNKSIEFCAKARNAAEPVRTKPSKEL